MDGWTGGWMSEGQTAGGERKRTHDDETTWFDLHTKATFSCGGGNISL